MTIEDMPKQEFSNLKRRVIQQLEAMDEAELEIKARAQESFVQFIGGLFQELARAMGYIIAFPFVVAASIARGIVRGFGQGWTDAWNSLGE